MTEKRETEAHEAEDKTEEVAREAEHLMFRDMAQYMSQFARSFEASARRWELVVYPSMLAFIILAAYGFYLIYKLTSDVDKITDDMQAISQNMVSINQNMGSITTHMKDMTDQMVIMTTHVQYITTEMAQQNQAMAAIVESMDHMNKSIDSMAYTIYEIRYDTRSMGSNLRNTTGPMRFMNSFLPW
jgi:uncharacterized protein YoxC